MKLVNGGITVEANKLDAQRLIAAGYVVVEEEPESKPAQPQAQVGETKVRKVAKKGKLNGNN